MGGNDGDIENSDYRMDVTVGVEEVYINGWEVVWAVCDERT